MAQFLGSQFDVDEDEEKKEPKYPLPTVGTFVKAVNGLNVLIGEVIETEEEGHYTDPEDVWFALSPPILEDSVTLAPSLGWTWSYSDAPEPPVGTQLTGTDGTLWVHKYREDPGWVGTERPGKFSWDQIRSYFEK